MQAGIFGYDAGDHFHGLETVKGDFGIEARPWSIAVLQVVFVRDAQAGKVGVAAVVGLRGAEDGGELVEALGGLLVLQVGAGGAGGVLDEGSAGRIEDAAAEIGGDFFDGACAGEVGGGTAVNVLSFPV